MLNGLVKGMSDDMTVGFLQGTPKIGTFVKAACAAILVSNDMKHIHLHASGEDFDKTHDLAGYCYDRISYECDYLAELAIENKENMPNFTLVGNLIQWAPQVALTYNYAQALQAITSGLTAYIGALEQLRNTAEIKPDVQSRLDDVIRDWRKELDYKMERRKETTEAPVAATI